MINLGSFEITSGRVVVSDPCYNMGTWCQERLYNVRTGTWIGVVEKSDEGSWGVRNKELIAYHKFYGVGNWEYVSSNIGVDSGQAGIYDYDTYRNNDVVGDVQNRLDFDLSQDGEKFYSKNCDLTCGTELSGGVLNGGVVSSSGYGDGCYDLYVMKDGSSIVAIKIVFIVNEDDEETCGYCGNDYDDCCCDEE